MTRLDEIKARCEAATEGPLTTGVALLNGKPLSAVFQLAEDGGDGLFVAAFRGLHSVQSDDDATFFAHARADVPYLVARVERLEEALRGLAERDCEYGDGCPTFGTRHGQCVGCIARAALEAEE